MLSFTLPRHDSDHACSVFDHLLRCSSTYLVIRVPICNRLGPRHHSLVHYFWFVRPAADSDQGAGTTFTSVRTITECASWRRIQGTAESNIRKKHRRGTSHLEAATGQWCPRLATPPATEDDIAVLIHCTFPLPPNGASQCLRTTTERLPWQITNSTLTRHRRESGLRSR